MPVMKLFAPRKMICFNKLSPLLLTIVMVTVVYRMTDYQHQHTKLETKSHPFDSIEEQKAASDPNRQKISIKVGHLPNGIIEPNSDMEFKPIWSTKSHKYKESNQNQQSLLAIPVGSKQKRSVDNIVKKFLLEKFAVILFHYDGDVNSWNDLKWSNSVIHVAAINQTKWWFAKRFLHPDVVSTYDFIFLWDEDIGVENFNPRRYIEIMKSEGLEISQPALDPKSYEIHHRITMRRKRRKVHRRVTGTRIGDECSQSNREPPCTGWVEGMVPVFSRSSWRCAWHLIQNDLIHGWGMDMKLGYCVQGDRTKKVGVIDSEFILHQGVQTLGGSSLEKGSQKGKLDVRAEIRRQSRLELQRFKERWDRAVREDDHWVDPFRSADN